MRGSVSIGAGRVAAYDERPGDGPALLFVHGNSASSRVWKHQLDGLDLAFTRRVAIDLLGHGESSRLPASEGYSVEALVDFVVRAARALRLDDAVLVGHSLGGHLLLEALDRLPHAHGVLICGTPPVTRPITGGFTFGEDPPFFQAELTGARIETWERTNFAAGAVLPPFFRRDLHETDPRLRSGLAQAMAASAHVDESVVVRSMRQPLAILHGAHDAVIDLGYLQRLVAPTLWQGTIHEINGAGHHTLWELPHAFNRLLAQFVREVQASCPA